MLVLSSALGHWKTCEHCLASCWNITRGPKFPTLVYLSFLGVSDALFYLLSEMIQVGGNKKINVSFHCLYYFGGDEE